jgi:hypothetical protein
MHSSVLLFSIFSTQPFHTPLWRNVSALNLEQPTAPRQPDDNDTKIAYSPTSLSFSHRHQQQ